MKKILAACYDRFFEFDSEEELNLYLKKLENGRQSFHIVEQSCEKGRPRIRVQMRYNGSPMYQELDEYQPHTQPDVRQEENASEDDPDALYTAICRLLPTQMSDGNQICCANGREILFSSQLTCLKVYNFFRSMGIDISCGWCYPTSEFYYIRKEE